MSYPFLAICKCAFNILSSIVLNVLAIALSCVDHVLVLSYLTLLYILAIMHRLFGPVSPKDL